MLEHPERERPPLMVFAEVDRWLAPGKSEPTRHPSGKPVSVQASQTAAIELSGTRMRERPLIIEQPFGRLFGVLTEPTVVPVADLCVVMLNAGAIRRVGPNRMWVEAARRWASLGVSTLRLDIESIGDADGDTGCFESVDELYDPQRVGQVIAALDALHEQPGAYARFALVGLCSGASCAFRAALQDERVVAAYMLNPRIIFWDRSLAAVRGFRRGPLRAASWRRMLRGEIPRGQIVTLAAQTHIAARASVRAAISRRRARGGRRQPPRRRTRSAPRRGQAHSARVLRGRAAVGRDAARWAVGPPRELAEPGVRARPGSRSHDEADQLPALRARRARSRARTRSGARPRATRIAPPRGAQGRPVALPVRRRGACTPRTR